MNSIQTKEHALAFLESLNTDQLEITWAVRCYHGCFDSKSGRVLDLRAKVKEALRFFEASVCYYPVGAFWVGFHGKYMSPDVHSFQSAVEAILPRILTQKEPTCSVD